MSRIFLRFSPEEEPSVLIQEVVIASITGNPTTSNRKSHFKYKSNLLPGCFPVRSGAISANDSELYIDGSTYFSYNSADFGGKKYKPRRKWR